MELRVKLLDISTGDAPVVLITRSAALTFDLHTSDRIRITAGNKSVVAVVNTTISSFGLHDSQIGMFLETALALGVTEQRSVMISPVAKPDSIRIVRKKIDGEELSDGEIRSVVQDIVNGDLTQVELTYFVAGCSIYPLSFQEVVSLTHALVDTGSRLSFNKPMVIDKHCIGGVPGNRTSMIVVPIIAALGFTMPKTSSRAITSPAGTADTMEVLAEVDFSIERMEQIVKTIGACLVWGGSVNLAPADDRIIRVERPLSIDVSGLMISSVLAKKASVGSTHVTIDIPYGPGAKVATLEHAQDLRKQFLTIGQLLDMHILVLLTDGSQPIGNGVGPLLEAYDVLAVLHRDESAPQDLREKSLFVAGQILEFIGHCKKGEGYGAAEKVLTDGRALAKFQEIVDAQGRKELPALAKHTYDVFGASGVVKSIDNVGITKISRLAGAPISKGAGLLLYAKVGQSVTTKDKICTIYAESEEKLANAVAYLKVANPYKIS
jgi:putative thymidine phosphorylase